MHKVKQYLYYYTIASLLIIEYFFLFFVLPNYYTIQSEAILYYIPISLLALCTFQYYLLERKIKNNPHDFIMFFVAVFGSKFIILLFASLIYINFVYGNNLEFVAIFFVNYFISMVLYVKGLVGLLKNK